MANQSIAPVVSVIVLSWNGMEHLAGCLDAVLGQEYPKAEVIVVDNHSTDGSADFIAQHYPAVKLIRNPANLGFSVGCNVGMRAATGDIIILLNQDTLVKPGWMQALVAVMTSDPSIGIAGCKSFYPDGRIQHAGGYVDVLGEAHHYGYGQPDTGLFDELRDVEFVTGAALAIRRRVLNTIGNLDEEFSPAYFEDVDFCFRARQSGFRVVYVPQAMLNHTEESSLTGTGYDGMYLFHRNRLRFALKHWPLEKLTRGFVRAEQERLANLGEGGELLANVLHHAYLHQLLDLSDLLRWRLLLHGATIDESDTLKRLLIDLRVLVPHKPAEASVEVHADGAASKAAGTAAATMAPPAPLSPIKHDPFDTEAFDWLHRKDSALHEHQFRSSVPLVGPLIAAFRRHWNRISTEWYVRPLMEQQTEINNKLAALLEVLVHRFQGIDMEWVAYTTNRDEWDNTLRKRLDQQEAIIAQLVSDHDRLSRVLTEYIREDGHEISELASEIERLQNTLRTLQPGNPH